MSNDPNKTPPVSLGSRNCRKALIEWSNRLSVETLQPAIFAATRGSGGISMRRTCDAESSCQIETCPSSDESAWRNARLPIPAKRLMDSCEMRVVTSRQLFEYRVVDPV